MATHLVNLDALIQREDFEAGPEMSSQSRRLGNEVKVGELESTYLHLLKKPDFQRTTNNWSPERVCEFVKSFLDGDLIPAIIMWRSQTSGTLFVIDGAHRISALLAWVHDDYGDGNISREFWGYSITPPQQKLAIETKRLIEREIGPYKQLKQVLQDHSSARDPVMLLRAKNMATFKIDLQWVEGNAQNAERSFFRINGSASIIDPTELEIIKARRKPNAIATRALMNAGMGHRYWSDFPKSVSDEIESLSKEIYETLFKPIIETPIKTIDLPIAGQGYSENAFKMVFDLVNLLNEVTPSMWQEKPPPKVSNDSKRKRKAKPKPNESEKSLEDDKDGESTVTFLKAVKKAALLVSGNHPGSLGLHPVVYFYGNTGKFQPSALLATIRFVKELEEKKWLIKFTDNREAFEEFLIRHRHFVSHLGHTYGSGKRPLEALVTMYRLILDEVLKGERDPDKIAERLIADPKLSSLSKSNPQEGNGSRTRKIFSADEKSAAFIERAINQPVRCGECGARLHFRNFNIDHDTRKQDGGLGEVANAVPTHFFCNSGYKEKMHSDAMKKTSDCDETVG